MESLKPKIFRPKGPYSQREAWSGNRLPPTDALAGKEVALERDDGQILNYQFDSSTVSWQEPGETSTIQAPYDAVELRDDVFSVDFLHPASPGVSPWRRVATSLALSLENGGAVLVRTTITFGEHSDFRQDIYASRIAGSGGSFPAISADLVGRRAYAEYSDGTAAEHVYLNPRRFGWQGLGAFEYSGSESDESTTWKLGDELYVLTWVEEWEPVGAVLLMDFTRLRNAGIIIGRDDQGFFHYLCGGRLGILSQTTYPLDKEPAGVGGTSECASGSDRG